MAPLRFFLLFCLVFLLGAHARAESEAIRIEYTAAAGCPSAREFQRAVFERTTSARLADSVEAARVFNVELKHTGDSIVGSLVIREKSGASVARRVSGAKCSDVALVLALASALAIDPRAQLGPRRAAEPKPPAASEESGKGSRESSPNSESDLDAPELETSEFETVEFDRPEERAYTRRAHDWAYGIALGPNFGFGPAPGTTFGIAASLLSYQKPGRAALGVELVAAQGESKRVAGASADFRFGFVRPRICPYSFDWGSAVLFSACLAAELGVVHGQGSGLPQVETSTRFWSALQLPLRLELPIAGNSFMALEGGVGMPLTRYRFVFKAPETVVYPVPALTGTASFQVGWRL